MPTDIERLYREHRAGLVRLVERELHDRHDAEDVVQTAFLDAQRALERGTIPRNARAWLAAIALNAARRLRRRRVNVEPLGDYAAQEAPDMSEIRAALTSLPREQQAAVLYRDVLGLSYGETAERMDRSVNAVTMLLHRGRRRLRRTLGVIAAGVGLWRAAKRAYVPQVAVVKGAAAVVAAASLATAGIVSAGRAARAVAPETGLTPAPATRSGGPTERAGRTAGGASVHDSARLHSETADGSSAGAATATTRDPSGDVTPASLPPPTADVAATSRSTSKLQLPTVSLPTLSTPTLPATVAATVTVGTPITTATVTASVGTTVTVTTPVTTVTLPVP